MKLKGSIDMPEYEGTLAIQDASFLFVPLQLRYTLTGQLVPRRHQYAAPKCYNSKRTGKRTIRISNAARRLFNASRVIVERL